MYTDKETQRITSILRPKGGLYSHSLCTGLMRKNKPQKTRETSSSGAAMEEVQQLLLGHRCEALPNCLDFL